MDDQMEDMEVDEGSAVGVQSNIDCIVAFTLVRHVIGLAVYDGVKSAIYTTQFSAASSCVVDRMDEILLALHPRLIVTSLSTSNNESLFEKITNSGLIEHAITKSTDWDYKHSKLCIVEHLYVRDLIKNTGDSATSVSYDNYQLLASEIDFADKPRVCALGGLVKYLQKNVFTMEQHGHVHVNLLAPVENIIRGHCIIDPISLRALSIFVEDFHPSQVKGKGRSKEGFSVFGIFDRTSSSGGRRCLREWFTSPIADLDEISSRQDGIELFTVPEFKEIEVDIVKNLKKVQDTPAVLLRIKKVQSTFRDWVALSATFEALWSVLDYLRILQTRAASPTQRIWLEGILNRCNGESLHECYRLISESIDVDMTKAMKQTCIREGYSEELDHLRAKWDDVERVLETAAKRTLDELPEMTQVTAEFIAHVGYHIVIHATDEKFLRPECGLEILFVQDGMLYMKNDLMRRYDEEIGDLPSQYLDLVREILRGLEEDLIGHEFVLTELSTAIGEVDAIMSLARVAVEYDFVRPKMVESPVVLVKGGRHPLQQLVVDTFIPNDIALGVNEMSAAVITGPNFSGKSVYMKQVGLLVFLAHVGSWIPCENAIIGVCDRIFTRIESIETCTVPQSTFTIDLNQMTTMLRRCTSKSLLLIDEFGKGTSPADGMSLLGATVGHLSEGVSPRMVVATHFLELFEYNLMPDKKILKCRMDYILPESQLNQVEESDEDLVPLFRLVPGVATSSDGLACARLGGLPSELIERARQVMLNLEKGLPINPIHDISNAAGVTHQLDQGTPGFDLLELFLKTPSFSEANDETMDKFKNLAQKL